MRGLSVIEQGVHALAARQHGLVARRQLMELGLGEDAIDHRLATGRLTRIERGVYALGHAELRREGRVLAVVLNAGEGAMLSHRSAAALWGIRPWSGAFVEITRPGRQGLHRVRGRMLHCSSNLPAEELAVEQQIPTTSIARTLLDLAAVVPAHHVRRAVERSEQAELFDLTTIERVLARHSGRPGSRALSSVLADMRNNGVTTTRSDLESLLLQICIDHRLPRPQVNRYDGRREVDFRWPRERLIVEVDSWTFHGRTRQAFDGDRARDRQLLREGWRVARFTDRQLLADGAAVAHELRELGLDHS
jgi:very-short-patch-repair endonuclease